jgi:ribosomal protein S10
MAEPPMTRHRKKASEAKVKESNRALMEKVFQDLEEHSERLEEHSKRARKLAETVKNIEIIKKPAGRKGPTKKTYQQVTTKTSDKPIT